MSNIDRVVIKTTNSSKILLISQKIRPNCFHSSDNLRHFCPEIFIQFLLWGLFFTFSSLISRAGFSGQATAQQRGRRQQKLKQLSPSLPPFNSIHRSCRVKPHSTVFFMLMCVFDPWPWFLSHPIEDSSGHSQDSRGERGSSAFKDAGLEGQSAFKEIYFREEFPLNEIAAGVDFLTPVRPCESLTNWLPKVSAYLSSGGSFISSRI